MFSESAHKTNYVEVQLKRRMAINFKIFSKKLQGILMTLKSGKQLRYGA